MATKTWGRQLGDMYPIPEARPRQTNRVSIARRLRRDVGALLENLWELSGSVRLYKGDAVVVEGTERVTGHPLRAFYFGHYDNYAFILGRMCSDFQVVDKHPGINSIHVRKWLEKYSQSVSLLCVDVELLYCHLLRSGVFLRIPQWVRQKYRVPDTWEGVLRSFRKNTRRTDLRKVRQLGLTFRMSRSEDDYRDFYHRMYVPYIRKRFQAEALVEPEWKVLRQCRKGELMHIVRDDRVVAAVLFHRLGGRLAYVWVGVPDDADDDLYKGAFSAMYYFTILYGYEHGCTEVDFLGSRPLLNDGLFRYKRKWGTYVEDSPVPRGDILLRPLRFSEAVRSYLQANPFIVRSGTDLAGKILLNGDTTTPEQLEDLCTQFYTEGLKSLKLVSTSRLSHDAVNWAATSGAPVQLFDLEGSGDPAAAFCRL